MTVAAFLPPRLLRHLQYILGRERPLAAASWAELEEFIRLKPVSVAIVDPFADGADGTKTILEFLIDYPSIQVIAYVTVTPQSFQAIAELSRMGLKHVLLYSFDDSQERFMAMLQTVRAKPLTVQLLQALGPSLDKLPLSVRRTVEDMFAEPERYVNASDIASGANIPLVRLYRVLRRAGVAAPKKLLVATKMLRAYGDLADPAHSVRRVSRKLGYRYSRVFVEHTFELFGFAPSHVRDRMTDEQVVARVVEWLTTGNEDAAEKAG